MKRIMAVSVLTVAGLLSVVGCTKTVYVTTTDAPAAPTSTIIPTTTVVTFSNDLRLAAASCLDSMPEMWLWDEPRYINGLERNVEECRDFRVLGLAEKVDSKTLDKLTTDLSEYLSTIEFIISWDESCGRAINGGDLADEINCATGSTFANENLSEKSSRASEIFENLQALLSQ